MSYTVNDLREDLAATIKALRSKEDPMPVDRAKAVAEVAQTIINSAKVEVDMVNALGHRRMTPTGFIPLTVQDTLDQQERHTGNPLQLEGPKPKPHVRNPMGESPRGSIR